MRIWAQQNNARLHKATDRKIQNARIGAHGNACFVCLRNARAVCMTNEDIMHHFTYQNGTLHAENVNLHTLANAVGTPCYVYSVATIRRHFNVFKDALAGLNAKVCYAVKANTNGAVIKTLAKEGAGADVVSVGELKMALQAGVPAQNIVYSGVGKTREDLAYALSHDIMQINVESVPELERLSEVAVAMGKTATIAIRVNPDVDAATHAKITTGKAENKFGIEWVMARDVYAKALALPNIHPAAIAVHIGSQITDLEPFENAFIKVRDLVAVLQSDGVPLTRVDLGGGLGVPYDQRQQTPPVPQFYGDVVRRVFGDWAQEGGENSLMFEPGRVIMANAGILLASTIYVKDGATKSFLIADAGMNDLVRPAMYEAHHDIVPVQEAPNSETQLMDVVGPICETGDTFAKDRPLPPVQAGDLIAFLGAGAYGAVMSGTYNGRLLVPEVLVDGDRYAVIRRRQTFEEMVSLESIPEWL
jgi:diaminopimelate decarboxylase